MQSLHGVTLVYNLRVRRIFNVPFILEQLKKPRKVFSAVPVYFSRTSHITEERTGLDIAEKRRAGGSLLNLRYVPSKHWWLEATTAIATDHAHFKGTDTFDASRAGLDDIVFAGGYRYICGKSQLVGYGLVGFPSTRKITRCDRITPLLGTRFYNIGFGVEGSYSFVSELKRSCAVIAQYRLIHGFNRNWFPILPKGSKIQPGNVQDILLTLQYRKRRTLFEGGYNATIFTNQAVMLSNQTIETESSTRHGGYVAVSHAWLDALYGKPFICGAGLNMSHANRFDAKTATVWVYGAIVF